MMEIGDEQAFDYVRRHMLKTRGIDLSSYSRSFTMRVLRKRMNRVGTDDHMTYVAQLRRSEEETDELVKALSINVTDFFRDRGAFEALAAKAVRPLLTEKSTLGWSSLRIWSAGCATGQETYTLAICVAEELKRLGENSHRPLVRIIGTDLSSRALGIARRAEYASEQLKGLSSKLIDEYFVAKGDMFELSPSITRMVRFSRANLLDKPEQNFFDAVVCRNVIIYFSRGAHDAVIINLHRSLRAGGFLMLGRTETLMGAPRSLFESVDPENRIFRKKPSLGGGSGILRR
jgi:chemotaxis methyl-accepting protein methylase